VLEAGTLLLHKVNDVHDLVDYGLRGARHIHDMLKELIQRLDSVVASPAYVDPPPPVLPPLSPALSPADEEMPSVVSAVHSPDAVTASSSSSSSFSSKRRRQTARRGGHRPYLGRRGSRGTREARRSGTPPRSYSPTSPSYSPIDSYPSA
jgi:hypothetical protein